MVRVGLVDFDTSHVVAFTQRLNGIDVAPEDRVEGAFVAAGCPGTSAMMPERIDGYARQLQAWGVELVDRPEDLVGRVDAVMVESQQGSRHLAHAIRFLEAGLPTFVDKPFANDLADADAMLRAARGSGAPLMSCSALRFDPVVRAAAAPDAGLGLLHTADVYTPAALHPGNPGLLHYGIHGVEMLYALMGTGCAAVQCVRTGSGDITVGRWATGELGVVRGLRTGQYGFGLSAHYERGHRCGEVQGAAFYAHMLRAFVDMAVTGCPPVPYREMREVVAFCVAAEASACAGGSAVALAGAREEEGIQ